MKKITVYLQCIMLIGVMLITVFLGSCSLVGAKPETFTKSGMSITLTDDFFEDEYVGYTSCYRSQKIQVFVLKEFFGVLSSVIDSSAANALRKYTELLIEVNKSDADIRTADGLTYFEYDYADGGNNYTYVCYTYKSNDAFWLIQFAFFTRNYDSLRSTVKEYAASVTFN